MVNGEWCVEDQLFGVQLLIVLLELDSSRILVSTQYKQMFIFYILVVLLLFVLIKHGFADNCAIKDGGGMGGGVMAGDHGLDISHIASNVQYVRSCKAPPVFCSGI